MGILDAVLYSISCTFLYYVYSDVWIVLIVI
jgi:hypothetical protein